MRRLEYVPFRKMLQRQRRRRAILRALKKIVLTVLLLMMALACISYGISMGLGRSVSSRSADFSLFGEEPQIDAVAG